MMMTVRHLKTLLTVVGALVLGGAIFAACGGGSDPVENAGTVNDAGTTSSTEATTSDTLTSDTATSGTAISFANDVQPVLEENCVSCHSGTGPGTTHLVMESAGDVTTIADFMAFRVEAGEMPPAPLSGLQEIAYQFDLEMTPEDRQTIIDWAAGGGELDVAEDTSLTATSQTFPPIDADLVLAADGPYPGSDKLDDYRCRIIDPEFTDTSWVTSIETRIDESRVLHHSIISILPADLRADADALDGADGAPGWNCQTVSQVGGEFLSSVAGWAPGTGPITLPEGTGIQMDAGDTFVVQWHYHYDSEPLPDNSGLAIEIADDAEVAAAGGALAPARYSNLVGPAEIPCASFESGPLCDRDAAVERIAEEFGFQSTLLPEVINRRCGVTPEDFAHFTDGVASSSCDLPAPVGQVISMTPHMHELGSTYRLTLNPDTPEEQVLIDIDQWDFDWQLGYYPEEALTFDDDDVLRLECGWDRSLWPAGLESRYIVWADGTQDEMCFTGLAVS